jgi:hypothetical protein
MTKDTGEVVQLVDKMVSLCFGGRVPDKAHDAAVVNALLLTCFPPQDAPMQMALAHDLVQALDLLRRQQTCQRSN